MTSYRAAIIGCGGIAHAHVGGYQALANVQVVAAAEIDEDRGRAFADKYSIPALYHDYQEMVERERLDLVSVCTWPPLHAGVTVAAAEAGARGILCEKPMAVCLAEADRMLEACERAGALLVIGHQRRFSPYYQKARELIQAGSIGELKRIHYRCQGDLLTDGTHAVDLIRFYAGDPELKAVIGQIHSDGPRLRFGHLVEDAALAHLQFDNGVVALLEMGRIAPPGLYQFAHLEGTEGDVEIHGDFHPNLRLRTDRWQDIPFQHGSPFQAEIEAMITSIETGAPHVLDGRQGRRALEALIAIFESSRRRARVELPIETPDYPLETMVGGR